MSQSAAPLPGFLAQCHNPDGLVVPWRGGAPQLLQKPEVNLICQWASESAGEISDIVLTAGNPASVLRYGDTCFVMGRDLADTEVLYLCNELTGNGGSIIRSGTDYDFRYKVLKQDQRGYYFYRVNLSPGVMGPSITFRIIPEVPPDFEEYGFEPELARHMFFKTGMLIMSGVTGSGKTTALATLLGRRLTTERLNVLTYESPPEFDFYQIPGRKSVISQIDIPLELPNYPAAVRNSLRRAPHIVYIGEARDTETIDGAVAEVRTGHGVLTTTHTKTVAGTLDRMASLFPPDKYRSAMISLIDAMTVIINQRLVKSTDGKRVAVREWIAFDDALKTRLMLMEPREIGPYLAEYINNPANDNARSILASADRLYAEGKIDKLRLTEIRQSAGHDLAELAA